MKSQLVRIAFLGLLLSACLVNAAEYQFYSAAGVKVPMLELSGVFNRNQVADKIVNNFDTAGAAEKKFLEDSKSACLITTQVRLDNAFKMGALKGQPPIQLVDTLAGLAASGSSKPTIQNPQELSMALLNAKSIAFSDPARGATVGRHFVEVIKKLGIEQKVMQKSILASDGVETMKLVLDKKVDLGITQMSEIIQADRSAVVGPFPPEFELATRYALYCKTPDQGNLQAFIALLKSKYGSQVFTYYGLRPAP